MMKLISGLGVVLTLLATACTTVPSAAPDPVVVTETILTPRERLQRAIQLLDEGNEDMAMVEIDAMLATNPHDATAVKLRDQVKTDPEKLLGESHFPYAVKPGETTSSLAKSYLGDPLLFYALSRYNNLEAPNRLRAGQTLKMPDSSHSPATLSKATVMPSGSREPVKVASAEDVAEAKSLRLQALEQLNTGDSDGAVILLRRAQSLDSNNPNISADLAKVERIQKALSKSN